MYAKALNDKGEIIIVKIQNIRKLYYLEQVLYGVAKTITEYISLGEDYLYHGQNHFIGVHTKDQLVVNTKEECDCFPATFRDFPRIHTYTGQRVR